MPKPDPMTFEEMEEKRQEKKAQRKAWLEIFSTLLEFINSVFDLISIFTKR